MNDWYPYSDYGNGNCLIQSIIIFKNSFIISGDGLVSIQ